MDIAKSVTVAIQGEIGSYHDIAARHYFGSAYQPLCKDTFDDVYEAVIDGTADFGLSAVENSLVGSIPAVYDLLGNTREVQIIGEIYLGIHHSLLGLPGSTLDGITNVYSHPVALAQCTAFTKKQLPHAATHVAADTAGSAIFVKESGNPAWAAIAGRHNAQRLGLQILAENLENNPQNYTRFLALARSGHEAAPAQPADKTSLYIQKLGRQDDLAPGILHTALGCFAEQNIALTKIESRPIGSTPWRYVFYIDCLAGAQEPRMQTALGALTAQGAQWRVLGSYPQGEKIR